MPAGLWPLPYGDHYHDNAPLQNLLRDGHTYVRGPVFDGFRLWTTATTTTQRTLPARHGAAAHRLHMSVPDDHHHHSSCPPATAAYCGAADCGEGGIPSCDPFFHALCPQGMTCATMGATCGCTGATIPCGDSRLSGLTCNFCKWGTCPPGMTCGGDPKTSGCGFDCACQCKDRYAQAPDTTGSRMVAEGPYPIMRPLL